MFAPVASAADEAADPYEDTLFGHWGGVRDTMAKASIDATVEYKADF